MLRRLGGVTKPPVPVLELAERAGILVDHDPKSGPLGAAHLLPSGQWRIVYPDPEAKDLAMTVGYQLKLILDYPFGDTIYPPLEIVPTHLRKHYCAEYFAACLILPREWLTDEWQAGNQDLAVLADLFRAPAGVVRTRLQALDLLA
jgi:hypothetical protein